MSANVRSATVEALVARSDQEELLAEHLSADGDDGLGVLSSAVGARLALRSGQVGEARALLRVHSAAAPADSALLRWVDGNALLAMGEGVSAEQFAAEVVEPVRQGELVRVALAAQAGRVSEGLRLLEGARGDEGLARANVVRRRAELYLREGSYGRATRAAREAAGDYAGVGEHVSSAQALRLAADAAALAGHLEEAANLYLAVLALQVRLQDLAGLQATLLRAARVDDARGATESATLRREQAEAVARARGVWNRDAR
jgi:hypothetical protein